jgi:hypothetical protein
MTFLQANLVRFGITAGEEKSLELTINDFLAANTKANQANAGSHDRIDCKVKADAATVATRDFVNKHLRYTDAVTDADRSSLGLHIPDTHPTPAPTPTSLPVIQFYFPSVCRVGIELRDSESGLKTKPAHVHGAELRYAILSAPPAAEEELVHSDFSTRSTYVLQFNETQRSKTVYIFARWENTRGEKGPRSTIYSAVIP